MLKKAPDFTLLDQDGIEQSLADYRGRWLVLYFYPSDRSLNCNRQACYFRDEQKALAQFGNAAIVGINKAPVATHKRFVTRNHLHFPILSDPNHAITEAYGAWRTSPVAWHDKAYGTRRNTYLINPDGMIAKEYLGVIPRGHVEMIIKDLQKLQKLAK